MTEDLKVLLWNPDASPFGGHVVQLDMTARFLSRIDGISVHVCRDERPDWDGIDVVHGLGLDTMHIRKARSRGIPVCLSVIYVSKAYRTGLLTRASRRRVVSNRARMALVMALAAARGRHLAKSEAVAEFSIRTRALLEAADLLLPNSSMEAETLANDLGVSTPMRVVPNAVDPASFPTGLPWDQREGVLYVGRLEPHKNQLRLIEALHGTDVSLTILGGDHPHHGAYADEVRAAASDMVRVVGYTPHDRLSHFYTRVRVHATPSLFETTGLVSLEAGLSGCNVVTTDVGYAREYFEHLVWYCDPYDVPGIRAAVLAALSAPPQDALRQRILERYTWEHAAAATAAAYRDVVAHRL